MSELVVYTKDKLLELVSEDKHELITDELLDRFNTIHDDVIGSVVKSNFINYINYYNGNAKDIVTYLNACVFVTYIQLDYSKTEAWKHTFPDKWEELKNSGKDYLASNLAHGYSKTNLVVDLTKKTLVASHVTNAPLFQRALDIAMDIAEDPTASKMARVNAVRTVLEYTKMPEDINIEVNVKQDEDNVIDRYLKMCEKMNDTIRSNGITAEQFVKIDVVKGQILTSKEITN